LAISQKGQYFVFRRRIRQFFIVLQSPLPLGAVNLPEIVDARIRLRRFARFDEVRYRYGRQHPNDRDANHSDDAENDQDNDPGRQSGFLRWR
jgi:hypothetical protein